MGLFCYQGAYMYMQLEVLFCASVFNEDVAPNYHRGPGEPAVKSSWYPELTVVTKNAFHLSD